MRGHSQLNLSPRAVWGRSPFRRPAWLLPASLHIAPAHALQAEGEPLLAFAKHRAPVIPTEVNPHLWSSCRSAAPGFTQPRNLPSLTSALTLKQHPEDTCRQAGKLSAQGLQFDLRSMPSRTSCSRFLIATRSETEIAASSTKQTVDPISNRNKTSVSRGAFLRGSRFQTHDSIVTVLLS